MVAIYPEITMRVPVAKMPLPLFYGWSPVHMESEVYNFIHKSLSTKMVLNLFDWNQGK